MIGLGIDTGGTCTDAVLYDMDSQRILSVAKTATTKERLENGIEKALGMLDRRLLEKADFLALSTTLATNACVENRGCSVKLLFIGVEREIVEKIYRQYGFDSMDDLLFIRGVPEGGNMEPVEPDWDGLEKMLPAFADCQAIGIVQLFPSWNQGAFEKKAKEILEKAYAVPVVCGSELFSDLNAVRRGAGTYLNSRLIPIIQEFLQAIRHSLQKYDLSLPTYIVRSDGSLMNEKYAAEHPVETLLCGPAASVLGGAWMADCEDALVIDMGGTTTDIGMLKGGNPQHVSGGILINHWKTFVKGMAIDTFGLGGDTAVHYKENELYLERYRVVPFCMAAAQFPSLARRIRLQPSYKNQRLCPYEGFFYMKEPELPEKCRASEREILAVLKEKGPLFLNELAEEAGCYTLEKTVSQLEREGCIQRFGLTPTDMMHVLGNYEEFDVQSAKQAVNLLAKVSQISEDSIPERVYNMVKGRLYANIIRILFDGFEEKRNRISGDVLAMAENSFTTKEMEAEQIEMLFHTNLTLVGVGGPIHIFLPDVAKKLGTDCQIFEDSRVANAIGTLVGRVSASETCEVNYEVDGFSVYDEKEKLWFEEYALAETEAIRRLKELAARKAIRRGAVGELDYEVNIEKLEAALGSDNGDKVLFGSTVTVIARGSIYQTR